MGGDGQQSPLDGELVEEALLAPLSHRGGSGGISEALVDCIRECVRTPRLNQKPGDSIVDDLDRPSDGRRY